MSSTTLFGFKSPREHLDIEFPSVEDEVERVLNTFFEARNCKPLLTNVLTNKNKKRMSFK